ncbi:Na+/H+ antiporter subunit E [Lysinibacter cavernae]|uniref:Multicomponent Na+:H+ antiporter subunit E n=1 Tax=Lysinibacter cavernae TaxID=1640652 RepID=A0A7X5R177_9MICO|nr:Na+/H+ antiporter subunit E [Lysinibacter cavernae]NIH53711.1 multicomponent Na+:H+ antiporter subunit E [Lysinibacter cavernae]
MTEQTTALAKRASLFGSIVLQLGLVAIWVLLWGQLNPMTIITGVLVSVIVGRVFYLPPVDFGGRFSPWHFLLFSLRMIWDVVSASLHVAWLAIDWRYTPSNAVIAIDLHTRNDLIMTWTVEAISLVPGTIVIEADREERRLFLHVLDVDNAEDIEKLRLSVRATEERLTMAFGSRNEVQRMLAERQSLNSATPSEGGAS